MHHCNERFFALLWMVAPCLAAHAADIDSAAGKCLAGTHAVKTIHEGFDSSAGLQRILITRELSTDKGDVACVYHIGWEFYQAITHTWLSEGDGWTYRGPGLIFSDGSWHSPPQYEEKRLDVAAVKVLGNQAQLAIYREDDPMGGTYSDLAIYTITNGYGVPKTLLHVANRNPLTYSIHNQIIDIKGDYFGPNACNACGVPGYEVKLKYDPDADQMAIIDPTKSSEKFYKSIFVRSSR